MMTTYVLEHANGAKQTIEAEHDADAASEALEIIGDDAVAAEQWDADGTNDDGEPMERLLIWATEADAQDDPGANAVAELTVVR